MIGQTIAHYTITEKLGAGGMGEVFLAEDSKLDRQIALKFLPQSLSLDDEFKTRFIHEAKAAASLNHPNIITVHDIGEHDGRMYIAMEYIRGRSLEDLIRSGPLSLAEVLDYAIQLADGLSAAHEAGIVHRDIKPANIIVDTRGHLKILDFGLARIEGATKVTKEGSTLGTLLYKSPEQARGEQVDQRSDIFSFGCVLYEMIAGAPPFSGDYDAAIVYSIAHEEPAPLAEKTGAVTAGVQEIVSTALQKDPSRRYQTIADALADLKRERDALSTPSRIAIAPLAPRISRKSKLIAGAVIVLALATVTPWLIERFSSSQVVPIHRQVTFFGDTLLSDLSPDGTLVAFTRRIISESRDAVLVKDLQGGDPIEVFSDNRVQDVEWSPDGSELLIASHNDSVRGVYRVHRMGGTPRRYPIHIYPDASISWAPDGRSFVAQTPQSRLELYFVTLSDGSVDTVHLPDTLGNIFDLAWEPVGNRIYFRMASIGPGNWKLMSVNSEGRDPRVSIHAWTRFFDISMDGNTLYFLRMDEGGHFLSKIDIDVSTGLTHGDPELLLSGLTTYGPISVSGDTHALLYPRSQYWSNIWKIDIGESEFGHDAVTTQLTTGATEKSEPSISPDGQTVAFEGAVGSAGGGNADIFTVPIDGGAVTRLTFTNRTTRTTSWSPDSKEIAFISVDGTVRRVHVINRESGELRKFDSTECYNQLAWYPGDRILYQIDGRANLHFLDPQTGATEPLYDGPDAGAFFYPKISPDGKKVAVRWIYAPANLPANSKDSIGTWVFEPAKDSRKFFGMRECDPIGWHQDNVTLFMHERRTGALLALDTDTRGIDTLLTMPFASINRQAEITQDGRKMVVSVPERQSDIWLIRNFDPDTR